MYSSFFRGVCPKAHILLHRPVNAFTTKSNLPVSLFNLNPPRSNTTPYYTTLQPRTPHTPPLFQHCHRFPPRHNIGCPTQESFSFSPFHIAAAAQGVVKGLIGYSWGSLTWTSGRFCIEVGVWLVANFVLDGGAGRQYGGNGILYCLGVDQMA